MNSHGVKPHSDRGHQKAECEDPSQERCLGEDAGLGLPPGRLGGSQVLHLAAGSPVKLWCLQGIMVLGLLGQQALQLLKQLDVEQEGGLGLIQDPLPDLRVISRVFMRERYSCLNLVALAILGKVKKARPSRSWADSGPSEQSS